MARARRVVCLLLSLPLLLPLLASTGCSRSEVDLTVEIHGVGHVVGTSGGIDCLSDVGANGSTGVCEFTTEETTGEILDAHSVSGSTFVGWSYEVSDDCRGSRCPESAPSRDFSETSTRADVPLQAYPDHAHIRVIATFSGP